MLTWREPSERRTLRERNGVGGVKRKGDDIDQPSKRAATEEQKVVESYEELCERTSLTAEGILSKKVQFGRRAVPAGKVKVLGTYVQELRCVGQHLLSQKDTLEVQNNQQVAEITSLEEQITNLKQDLSQTKQDLNSELHKKQEENSSLNLKIQILQQNLSDCENDRNQVKLKNQSQENQLQQKSDENLVLKEQISQLQLDLGESKNYSLSLQQYNQQLQQDMEQKITLLNQLNTDKNQLTEEVSVFKGEKKVLQKELISLQEKFEVGEQNKHAACAELQQVKSELNQIISERTQLNKKINEQNTEINQFRSINGDTLDELTRLRDACSAYQNRCDSQAQLIDILKRDFQKTKDEKELHEKISETRLTDINKLHEKIQNLNSQLDEKEQKIFQGEQIRRRLHNTIQELRGNIRVFCRVRPVGLEEEGGSVVDVTNFPPSLDLQSEKIDLTAPGEPTAMSQTQPQKYQFQFDKVFQQNSEQAEVFEEISQLVQSALDGYKVCIFAYGQTGSGKTYTMVGTEEKPGCIPMAMKQIFKTGTDLGQQGWTFLMQASMVEIYNEEIRDLLGKGPAQGKKHHITHDNNGNTSISEVLVLDVSTPEKVEMLMQKAMMQRAVGATACNEFSSRSHMVFTLRIQGKNSSTDQQIRGVLNLVDLAGSERVKESQVQGQRMKETQNINKSLSALGDVIFALSNKQDHIPYRNSKLTYLLQNSLGGDSKTLMFVNLNPSSEAFGESLCSLRFAAKVNACEVGTAKRCVTK